MPAPTEFELRPLHPKFEPFDADSLAPIIPPGVGPNPSTKWHNPKVWADILNAIANGGTYGRACVAAGVSIAAFKRMRKEHEVCEALVLEARELYREQLREVMHNVAVEGWLEPVYYQGECVGYVRKFSERLLERQMKAHCDEYKDRSQVDVNHGGGVLVISKTEMTRDEWLAAKRKRDAIDGEVVSG